MKYWQNTYGNRSRDFIEGVVAGLETLAVNKNGRQVVGVQETPIKVAIAEAKEQMGWNPEWDKKQEPKRLTWRGFGDGEETLS